MKQSKVALQPLDSERSRLKPPPRPPPPRPAPPTPLVRVLTHTTANAERTPNRKVIRRTVSAAAGDGKINSCPPHIRTQLNTSSRSRIASAPPEQMNPSLHVQRREFKGDAKNRLLQTQSTLFLSTLSAKSKQSPRPLSTSSMINLYSTREPHRPPSLRLPQLRPPMAKPNFGTLQNAKPSNLEARLKPARPPPPLRKVRLPIPLPDGECVDAKRRLSDSEQPDDSDPTYCYVCVDAKRRLSDSERPDDSDPTYCYVCVDAKRGLRGQCQSDFNSRIHSGKSARDDILNNFDSCKTQDSHIYSELLDTTRETDHDYYTLPDTSTIYTPLSSTTMEQASTYDVPSYRASQ